MVGCPAHLKVVAEANLKGLRCGREVLLNKVDLGHEQMGGRESGILLEAVLGTAEGTVDVWQTKNETEAR